MIEFHEDASTAASGALAGDELAGDGYGSGFAGFLVCREAEMLTLAMVTAPAWAISIMSSSSSSSGAALGCALRWAAFAAGDDGRGSLMATSGAAAAAGSSSAGGTKSSSAMIASLASGEDAVPSSILVFLAAGSRVSRGGQSARAFLLSADLSLFFGTLGGGRGTFASTSSRRSVRNLSSSSVLMAWPLRVSWADRGPAEDGTGRLDSPWASTVPWQRLL